MKCSSTQLLTDQWSVPCIRCCPCQHKILKKLLKKLQHEQQGLSIWGNFCGKIQLFPSRSIIEFNVLLDIFFWKALAFLLSFCQSFFCSVTIYWLQLLTFFISLTHFAQTVISTGLIKVTKDLNLAKSKGWFLLLLTWVFSNIWHKWFI